jgi:quercetin dioxygenase-like cupin family protein
MKRIAMLLFVVLLASGLVTVAVAPSAIAATNLKTDMVNVGDARELDTNYAAPFNVNLNEWFAAHRPTGDQKIRFDTVFQTPRIMVATVINKGQLFGLHYHTMADEIVFLLKGNCKEYVDGKWVPMVPGQIHYNPRGIIHGTQCSDEALELHYFTPVPGDADRVFLGSGKTQAKEGDIAGDWSMVDTQFKTNVLIPLEEWYPAHPILAGQTMRLDLPMGTMRNQMVIASKPQLGPHYHGSADEIIYVYRGEGEELINGKWLKLKAGDIHFCPRGFIHAIRPVSDDFKIFAVFTPAPANGADRIFVTPPTAVAGDKPAATTAPAK